MQLSNSWRNPA